MLRNRFPSKIVTIIIINTESKKSISISKTLCCVVITPRPKERPVFRQDTVAKCLRKA